MGSGQAEKKFKDLVKKLKIEESVFFIPHQPYELMPKFIKIADIVVAPNRDNNINRSRSSVKIAEYMAMSKPIVANSVGLVKEMLSGGAGELVKTENSEDFANSIYTLFKNKKLCAQIGKKAREKAVNYYSWVILGRRLRAFFIKIKV